MFKITFVAPIIFLLDRVVIVDIGNPKEGGRVNGCAERENRDLIIIITYHLEKNHHEILAVYSSIFLYILPSFKRWGMGVGETYAVL